MGMNNFDKSILTEMLKDMEFWLPIKEGKMITGYKLKMRHVHDELLIARQAIFYDEVYFPRAQRIMRLIKAMGIVPENVGWQEMEVGINKAFMIWYPCQTEWQDFLSNCFEPYFENRWINEWCVESPSEDELLALGVRPESMMATQEKLF